MAVHKQTVTVHIGAAEGHNAMTLADALNVRWTRGQYIEPLHPGDPEWPGKMKPPNGSYVVRKQPLNRLPFPQKAKREVLVLTFESAAEAAAWVHVQFADVEAELYQADSLDMEFAGRVPSNCYVIRKKGDKPDMFLWNARKL